VPVLSVQISFAPPIVSEALRRLTKLPRSAISDTEKAKEIVTASGRPSGTATTIIVTAMIKAFKKSEIFYGSAIVRSLYRKIAQSILTTKAIKVRAATDPPILPIMSAIDSSLVCRGVSSLVTFMIRSTLPDRV